MTMDRNYILRCCMEMEKQLLKVGGKECKSLTDNSQLSAVLFLLLRTLSLFRSMIHLLETDQLDALDCVRRSLLETWLLAFDLRMKDSEGKAFRWLSRQGNSWSADIKKIKAYSRSRNEQVLNLGKYYGELSELAHPTRNAAENSVGLTTNRFNINTEVQAIQAAREAFEEELPELLYRFMWLVLDEDKALIPLNIDDKEIPFTLDFVKTHPHL